MFFVNHGTEESDDVILNNKILNQEYIQKYWSNCLQTCQQKCTSQTRQNDTCYVVAVAVLLDAVFVPIYNLLNWDRGCCSGSHMVYTCILS